jgi:hypothetical protein
VSWIDNLVRPWVISGVSKIPFLLVPFVLRVILAILLAQWCSGAADGEALPPRRQE